MKPFYSFPLENLTNLTKLAAVSLRTLPDEQLAAEIDELSAKCGSGHQLATETMKRIYEQERERRSAPEHRFDDTLDAALSRLERQTTAEDRQLVREIGEKLFAIGETRAMRGAYDRMLEQCRASKRQLRATILERRWQGIGGRRSDRSGSVLEERR